MLLLVVAQRLRSLTRKQEENEQIPDKSPSKYDMSDKSCHFSPWQFQSKFGSLGMSFQGTTFCCAMYKEFSLHSKQQEIRT